MVGSLIPARAPHVSVVLVGIIFVQGTCVPDRAICELMINGSWRRETTIVDAIIVKLSRRQAQFSSLGSVQMRLEISAHDASMRI